MIELKNNIDDAVKKLKDEEKLEDEEERKHFLGVAADHLNKAKMFIAKTEELKTKQK